MDTIVPVPCTERLARSVYGIRHGELPDTVVRVAKTVILDTIGCMLGASRTPEARALATSSDFDGQSGSATVVGLPISVGAAAAAYTNAALAHVLELDDTHRQSIMHPAAPIVSAALAAAERAGASGMALVRAVVSGYEAGVRTAIAIQPSHWYNGYLSMGTCGAIGAAAASASILDLSDDGIAQSMGLAAIQSGGLNASIFARGDMGKITTPASGAANGLRSAFQVKAGLTGPVTILEGRFGVFEVWSTDHNASLGLAGLDETYEILRTGLKPYSCCRYIHGPLALLAEIVEENGLTEADIASIDVGTYEAAVIGRPHRPEPVTLFDAKMSIPYCLAILLDRGVFDETGMEEGLARRNEVGAIARKIKVSVDAEATKDFPAAWPCVVTAETHSGRIYSKSLRLPKGEPENPMSDDEIIAKFMFLAAPTLGNARAQALLAHLRDLDTARDLKPILKLLTV